MARDNYERMKRKEWMSRGKWYEYRSNGEGKKGQSGEKVEIRKWRSGRKKTSWGVLLRD